MLELAIAEPLAAFSGSTEQLKESAAPPELSGTPLASEHEEIAVRLMAAGPGGVDQALLAAAAKALRDVSILDKQLLRAREVTAPRRDNHLHCCPKPGKMLHGIVLSPLLFTQVLQGVVLHQLQHRVAIVLVGMQAAGQLTASGVWQGWQFFWQACRH